MLPALVWSHWLLIFYWESHAASCQTMSTSRKALSELHRTGALLQGISVLLSLTHLFTFRKPVFVYSNFHQDHKRSVLFWAFCKESFVFSFHLSHKNLYASVNILSWAVESCFYSFFFHNALSSFSVIRRDQGISAVFYWVRGNVRVESWVSLMLIFMFDFFFQ